MDSTGFREFREIHIDEPMVRAYKPGEYWLSKAEALIRLLKARYPNHSEAQLRELIEVTPPDELCPNKSKNYAQAVTLVATALLSNLPAPVPTLHM